MTPGHRDQDILTEGREAVERAAAAVRGATGLVPEVALILGSGLGDYAESFTDRTVVDYREIPGFPESTVPGHAGRLVLGHAHGVPVAAQQGRFHVYEGYPAARVVFPLRVLHALGARVLVVTNAAGGVNRGFAPGDLMLISDHVNFQFRSPLRGRGPLVDGDRFVDLAEPYSQRLRALAEVAARDLKIPIRQGVYWGNPGPAYETPAEVRMVARFGGDAVGMSTVPEVIVAKHMGMEVLGITCITNRAAGLSAHPLTHDEVMETANEAKGRLRALLDAVIPRLIASPARG